MSIMRENGMQTKEVGGDACTIKMEQYMKGSGMMIKETARVCLD